MNSDTQDADELMIHDVVYLNEKNCIPDKYETNKEFSVPWEKQTYTFKISFYKRMCGEWPS